MFDDNDSGLAGMAVTADMHARIAILDSLDRTELEAFRNLMIDLRTHASTTTSAVMASYYVGLAAAKLESRFGICPVCIKAHDEILGDCR